MDENESMDPIVIQGLFEQGVSYSEAFIPIILLILSSFQLMGIETNPDFGGSGSSFTSAIIAIEELAKVDPSVSVLCDVHNTLVNTVIRKYGTHEQLEKWLPQLSQSKVRTYPPLHEENFLMTLYIYSSAPSVSPKPRLAQMPSLSKHAPRRKEITGYSMAPKCGSLTHTKQKSSSSSPTYVFTPCTIFHPFAINLYNAAFRSTKPKDTRELPASSPPKTWASKLQRRNKNSASVPPQPAPSTLMISRSPKRISSAGRVRATKSPLRSSTRVRSSNPATPSFLTHRSPPRPDRHRRPNARPRPRRL